MARFNQLVAIEKVQSHTVSSNNQRDHMGTKSEPKNFTDYSF